MSGKIVYFLTVLALAAIVSATNGMPAAVPLEFHASKVKDSHNLIVGYRLPGDHLFLRQNIMKISASQQVVTVTQTFHTNASEVITKVMALDHESNDHGATVSVTAGGPGSRRVTLRFVSKKDYGINFVVIVYSKTG